MSEIRVVLISGYRRAGKDTIAAILNEKYGYIRVSFADALREACSVLFGIPMEDFLDGSVKEVPLKRYPFMSPRDALIKVGTDSLRDHFDPDIWVRLAAKRIADQMVTTGVLNYVMPDVRFLNEEDFGVMLKQELESRGIAVGSELNTLHLQVWRKVMTDEEKAEFRKFGHKSDTLLLDMNPDAMVYNIIEGDMSVLHSTANCINSLQWRNLGKIEYTA